MGNGIARKRTSALLVPIRCLKIRLISFVYIGLYYYVCSDEYISADIM